MDILLVITNLVSYKSSSGPFVPRLGGLADIAYAGGKGTFFGTGVACSRSGRVGQVVLGARKGRFASGCVVMSGAVSMDNIGVVSNSPAGPFIRAICALDKGVVTTGRRGSRGGCVDGTICATMRGECACDSG